MFILLFYGVFFLLKLMAWIQELLTTGLVYFFVSLYHTKVLLTLMPPLRHIEFWIDSLCGNCWNLLEDAWNYLEQKTCMLPTQRCFELITVLYITLRSIIHPLELLSLKSVSKRFVWDTVSHLKKISNIVSHLQIFFSRNCTPFTTFCNRFCNVWFTCLMNLYPFLLKVFQTFHIHDAFCHKV